MRKFKFLLFITLIAWFPSCNDELAEDATPETEKTSALALREEKTQDDVDLPRIVDDRLYFESFEAMNDFLKAYLQLPPEYLDAKSRERGFISWHDVLEAEDEGTNIPRELNNRTDTQLEDPRFTRILNYNQEIKVDKLIYRVEDEFVFIYVDGYYDQVARFKASGAGENLEYDKPVLINSKLIVGKLRREISVESGRLNVWVFGFGIRRSNDYDNFTSKRRMKSTHWATNVYFYKSAGMKTKLQRRSGLIWKGLKAQNIVVSGQVHFSIKYPGDDFEGNQIQFVHTSNNNSKTATHTIFAAGGFGVKISDNDILGISGVPGAKYTIKNISHSYHSAQYQNINKNRGPKNWPW
ncbi:MAG: hypothetical protein MI784_05415 [Cytophagales bacterium]|nr:hypothetical protein [Cytophagales bacterium]